MTQGAARCFRALTPCLFLAGLALLAPGARAQDVWTVTTSDLQRHRVQMLQLGPEGARVYGLEAGDGEWTVAPDNLVMLQRIAAVPRAAVPHWTMYTVASEQYAGEPSSIKQDRIVWKNALLGEVEMPVQQVLAITRGPEPGLGERPGEDRVRMANGDTLKGIITGLDGGKLSVQTGSDTAAVALDTVQAIDFAAASAQPAAAAEPYRVRLTDGSLFGAASVAIYNGQVAVTLGTGPARILELSSISTIEQVAGPVAFLSLRPPDAQEQVSFSPDLHWPARMDQTVEGSGRPISFAGRTYEHGIGVHANSTLTWNLNGSYAAFRTQYAIDSGPSASVAQVAVRVLLDGKVAYEQTGVRAGKLWPVVVLDLAGARKLSLVVTAEGVTDTQDRLNWIEAALLRKKPPK